MVIHLTEYMEDLESSSQLHPQSKVPNLHSPDVSPCLCKVNVSIKASQGCTATQDFVTKASQERTSARPRCQKVSISAPISGETGFLPFWEGNIFTTSTIEEFQNMKVEAVEKI